MFNFVPTYSEWDSNESQVYTENKGLVLQSKFIRIVIDNNANISFVINSNKSDALFAKYKKYNADNIMVNLHNRLYILKGSYYLDLSGTSMRTIIDKNNNPSESRYNIILITIKTLQSDKDGLSVFVRSHDGLLYYKPCSALSESDTIPNYRIPNYRYLVHSPLNRDVSIAAFEKRIRETVSNSVFCNNRSLYVNCPVFANHMNRAMRNTTPNKCLTVMLYNSVFKKCNNVYPFGVNFCINGLRYNISDDDLDMMLKLCGILYIDMFDEDLVIEMKSYIDFNSLPDCLSKTAYKNFIKSANANSFYTHNQIFNKKLIPIE